jgi:pyruvate dehydrogenase (quinone)
MAYNDPRWMGGLGMIGTKAVYNAVHRCDLLLMIGTDYPYSSFLPTKGDVIQIDERPMVLGRRTPTLLGVTSSARPALNLLLEMVKAKSDATFFERVARERRTWDEMLDKQSDPARSKDKMHPQAVARTVSDLAKADATFVFDTGLNTLWSGNWNPSKWVATHHWIIQQRFGRYGRCSSKWHSGIGQDASGDRSDGRRRFQYAEGRIHDGRSSQTAD